MALSSGYESCSSREARAPSPEPLLPLPYGRGVAPHSIMGERKAFWNDLFEKVSTINAFVALEII